MSAAGVIEQASHDVALDVETEDVARLGLGVVG